MWVPCAEMDMGLNVARPLAPPPTRLCPSRSWPAGRAIPAGPAPASRHCSSRGYPCSTPDRAVVQRSHRAQHGMLPSELVQGSRETMDLLPQVVSYRTLRPSSACSFCVCRSIPKAYLFPGVQFHPGLIRATAPGRSARLTAGHASRKTAPGLWRCERSRRETACRSEMPAPVARLSAASRERP